MYDGSFYFHNLFFFRDLTIQIPEIFPAMGAFPEEDLAFDKAAVFVIFLDGCHLFCGQGIFCDAGEVGLVLRCLYGEGDGYLAPLGCPFKADVCRMNAVGFGCRCYRGKLGISHILGRAVSLGS